MCARNNVNFMVNKVVHSFTYFVEEVLRYALCFPDNRLLMYELRNQLAWIIASLILVNTLASYYILSSRCSFALVSVMPP